MKKKYDKELQEIEKQMQLFKDGEIWDFQLLNRIKILTTSAYYDGKGDGINEMRKFRSLKKLSNFFENCE